MRVALTASLLWLGACACESPSPQAPAKMNAGSDFGHLNCGGSGDAGCAIMGGAFLLWGVMNTPFTAAEKKAHARSLWGTCEVQSLDENMATAGKAEPCEQVLLTLHGPAEGDGRQAWVTGGEFEISGLSTGRYAIEAYCEKYDTRAKIENLQPGTRLQIRIQVPTKRR